MQTKQRDLAPKLQVCMGHSPCLWFCACKTANALSSRITSLYASQATPIDLLNAKHRAFGPDLQVSVGCRPRLWIFALKTVPLAQE